MMTSSNGNIFRVNGPPCGEFTGECGNSPVPGEFPSQRPVTQGFDFYLIRAKRLSKQSRRRWFETSVSYHVMQQLFHIWFHLLCILPCILLLNKQFESWVLSPEMQSRSGSCNVVVRTMSWYRCSSKYHWPTSAIIDIEWLEKRIIWAVKAMKRIHDQSAMSTLSSKSFRLETKMILQTALCLSTIMEM